MCVLAGETKVIDRCWLGIRVDLIEGRRQTSRLLHRGEEATDLIERILLVASGVWLDAAADFVKSWVATGRHGGVWGSSSRIALA
jgi:hypothetical protein